MAVKKAKAKGKAPAKKPASAASKKSVKPAAVKSVKKPAAKPSKPAAKPAAKAAKPESKPQAKAIKAQAPPVKASKKETPKAIPAPAKKQTNTSKIVNMIAEKKAPKVKSVPAVKEPKEPKEPKEKKLSARAAKIAEKAAIEPVKERRFTFNMKTFSKDKVEFSTEEKLQALFQLQLIDSEIDRIRIVRGELPMEVNDLEDEIAGLQTRIANYTEDVESMQTQIAQKKQSIKDSNTAIKKYESQQMNVKNNREFDSLNKEIEFQQLEIQLSEKRIKEYTTDLAAKTVILEDSTQKLNERLEDLKTKKDELDNIIAETRKEEEQLQKFSKQAHEMIDERLESAYERIRTNARNGLAVVTIQRDACGGCFNKIPPQRQLDIRQHKKVIVCEHCGRILVDHDIEL